MACPECCGPLLPLAELSGAVGFRLFKLHDPQPSLPQAVAVSMPLPEPGTWRS
jgi:hypothetical protein